MPESKKFLGGNPIVETGTVLLGPDDELFQIEISDLTFFIRFLHDNVQPPVKTEQVGARGMRVSINTWHTGAPQFKVKVGYIWENDLFLAVRLEPQQNFRVLTYTFSMKGR
jgi:hypothetical protein